MTEKPERDAADHRINYGRLWPGKTYRADCSCGWSSGEVTDEAVKVAVSRHRETHG